MAEKLFVYGTLRHKWDKPNNFIGMARMSGKLYHLGGFPGAKKSDNPEDTIIGEIYEMEDITRYDHMEGYVEAHPETSYYVREKVIVKTEEGKDEEVWVYMFNQPVDRCRQITSGDWFNQ